MLSHWLNVAQREHVLGLNATADPKGAVAGGWGLTALLRDDTHPSMAAIWNPVKPIQINYYGILYNNMERSYKHII